MLECFIRAILGGVCIGIGGVAYLSTENHVVGAFLFSLGLLTIYTFSLNLYTGKVCYIPAKGRRFVPEVLVALTGNAVGTVGLGCLLRATKLQKLIPLTQKLVAAKLADTVPSTVVMAVLCGFLMSIAVLGYAKLGDGFGRHLILVLPVMVFILCGFEHSIADLFYFSLAGMWGGKALLYIVLIAAGNLAGGVVLPLSDRLLENRKQRQPIGIK